MFSNLHQTLLPVTYVWQIGYPDLPRPATAIAGIFIVGPGPADKHLIVSSATFAPRPKMVAVTSRQVSW
ncbi:MAG: hypothetical protein ABIG44_00100 [Planctomycetota bacterium]